MDLPYIEAGTYNTFCGVLRQAVQVFMFEFESESELILLKVLFHNW
jgi:hypothetical protein